MSRHLTQAQKAAVWILENRPEAKIFRNGQGWRIQWKDGNFYPGTRVHPLTIWPIFDAGKMRSLEGVEPETYVATEPNPNPEDEPTK